MTIPVVHCFDHNYVLPAGVAFQSLLEHARTPGATYALHVVGTGLTDDDRALLEGVVARFPQATLAFHAPPPLPISDSAIPRGAHFTKDLFYKFLVPDLVPDAEIALLADVDVVYGGDIAAVHGMLPPGAPQLLAGARSPAYASWRGEGPYAGARRGARRYFRAFTAAERDRLVLTAGLLVYNCARCRAEGAVRAWIDCAVANARRLVLPEQDVFGLVCGRERVKALPWGLMADALASARYARMTAAERAANPVWDEMYANPLQIHYASAVKPWKFPGMPLAGLWFDACIRAGLFHRWRAWYGDFARPLLDQQQAKRLFAATLRLGRREIVLSAVKRKARAE